MDHSDVGIPKARPPRRDGVWRAPARIALAVALAARLLAAPAAAQSTWDGGGASGDWSVAANWTNDALPAFDASTRLAFSAPGTTRTDSFLGNTGRTIQSLTVLAGSGSTLRILLNQTATDAGAARTLTLAAASGSTSITSEPAAPILTIGGTTGTVALGSPLLEVVQGGPLLTIARPIIETVAGARLTKSGTGTLVLGGSNTYSGATTVSAGVLQLATPAALYGGVRANWTAARLPVAAGAVLSLSVGGPGEFSSADVTQLAALGTGSTGFLPGSALGLDTTNAVNGIATYAGNLANPNGGANARGLVKLGTGILELTGTNTYTGPTRVVTDTLIVSRVSALYGGVRSNWTADRLAVLDGATLAVGVGGTAGFTSADVAALSALGTGSTGFLPGSSLGIDTENTPGGTFTVSNVIGDVVGGLNVSKIGAGTLVLSASNTYSGWTYVEYGGVLRLQGGANRVAAGNDVYVEGTLDLGGNSQTLGILRGGGTVATGGGLLTAGFGDESSTFAGTVSGTGGLTKVGGGTLELDGFNTYTGRTTVSGGTLLLTTTDALYGAVTSNWTAAKITVAGGAVLALNVGDPTEFSAAAVQQIAAIGTGSTGFLPGSALGLDTTFAVGPWTYSGTLANTNGGANARGLVKLGEGTLALAAPNTYTGTTTVVGGTLQIGTGGTAGGIAAASRVDIRAAGTLAFARSGAVSLANPIDGSGALVNAGGGELALTGSNTFSGTLAAQAGAGRIALAGGDCVRGAPDVITAGTVSLGNAFVGGTATIRGLTGAGVVDAAHGSGTGTRALKLGPVAASTFSGILADGTAGQVLAVVIDGPGEQALSGTRSTYSGGTTLVAGSLRVASDGSLGTGAITFAAGGSGTLAGTDAADVSVLRPMVLAGTGRLQPGAGATLVIGGTISGTGGLTIGGGGVSGTVFLGGSSAFSGPTTVAAGRLALGASAAIASSPLVTVAGGATLDVAARPGGYVVPAGQTLAGSGTIIGSVTFGSGATLSPGSADGGPALGLGGAAASGFPDATGAGVRIATVPEPGTGALLACGAIAALGLAMRRRGPRGLSRGATLRRQTSGVRPGTACCGGGSAASRARFGGKRSRVDSVATNSQPTRWPV